MHKPRNLGFGGSLAAALLIAIASNATAQSNAMSVVFKNNRSESTPDFYKTLTAANIDPAEQSSDLDSSIQPPVSDSELVAVQVVPLPVAPISNPIAGNSSQANYFADSRSVACRSANEWLPAKQLRQHAKSVHDLYCDQDACARQAANAIATFLQMQAEHQQDLAAANALRAYYAHAAILEQLELVQESEELLHAQKERQLALHAKGLAAAVDITTFDRESITLTSQKLELQQRDQQLTQSINEATSTQYDWLVTTVEPLDVRKQMIDLQYVLRFAQRHRHDLLALEYLFTQVNTGTVTTLAPLISSATGVASLPLPKRCFLDRVLGREDNSVLTCNLREAIKLAAETQSATVRREVTEKASVLELAYQRIELAEQTSASWKKRLEQLNRLAELGDTRPADIALAESSIISSKASEVERRLDAKLAEIEFAQFCGGLSAHCCQGRAWLITSPVLPE